MYSIGNRVGMSTDETQTIDPARTFSESVQPSFCGIVASGDIFMNPTEHGWM